MNIKPAQLSAQLSKQIAPIYRVSGDEPYQVQECADQIRAAVKKQGFSEVQKFQIEAGFDWNQIVAGAASMSLFGDKQLLDVNMMVAKPGKEGSAAISEYCESAGPDTVLLLQTGKLDAGTRKQKWAKLIDKVGVSLEVYPLRPNELGRWIEQKLSAAGYDCQRDVVALISEYVEGNMLAAAQEIEKLKLLCDPGPLTLEQAQQAITDSARYDPFDFVDTALQGDSARLVRMLEGLRQEGVNENQILWMMTDKLRKLVALKEAQATGGDEQRALQGLWNSQQSLVRSAASRLSLDQAREILIDIARLDWIAKGQAKGNVWQEILAVALKVGGINTITTKAV